MSASEERRECFRGKSGGKGELLIREGATTFKLNGVCTSDL